MSNHVAIATVTAVLRHVLQGALDDADPGVPGARVGTARINAQPPEFPVPGVNLFLYQSTPSAMLRNADLPARRSDGTAAHRPRVPLDLHYIVSFHGNDAHFEPQILLGIVTRALHEQPVLTRKAIEDTLLDTSLPFLQKSDLADADEPVRFSQIGLSADELSRLWSTFFQTPYVLSMVYRASVVTLDGAAPAHAAPPVRVTRVRADRT